MASKPNPSWTAPQKQLHKDVLEALDIAIPYSGPEIPRLDNHTPAQICDNLGVVKVARKAFDAIEKILAERFKPLMPAPAAGMTDCELRAERYVASKKSSERVALNQGKLKGLLEKADELGVDLDKLLGLVEHGELESYIPSMKLDVRKEEDEEPITITNTLKYHSVTNVETLRVEPI